MSAESPEEMQEIIDGYEHRSRALIKQMTQMLWYMRGGLTRNDAWAMSLQEREEAFELINENIKRTKDSKMPLL